MSSRQALYNGFKVGGMSVKLLIQIIGFIIFHSKTNSCFIVVCAFPYILAFTTDSIEIRLVVNGNLVHTAVVPELQLVASRVRHRKKAYLVPCVRSDSCICDAGSQVLKL